MKNIFHYILIILFIFLLSSDLMAKEKYIKIQEFTESFKLYSVRPVDEGGNDHLESQDVRITKGVLKWIQDDPNGFILDIKINETTTDIKYANPDEVPKRTIEDDLKWPNPFAARVWCTRGKPGQCKISITQDKDGNDYYGTQYMRVSRVLDNLLLLTNSIDFSARPKQGLTDCTVNYIDDVNWGDQYTRDLSKSHFRPNDLTLIYNCRGQECSTNLQYYRLDKESPVLIKYTYKYNPITKKVLGMSSMYIQVTDLTNLAELPPAELFKRLNDPSAPLRRFFYEIKLSE